MQKAVLRRPDIKIRGKGPLYINRLELTKDKLFLKIYRMIDLNLSHPDLLSPPIAIAHWIAKHGFKAAFGLAMMSAFAIIPLHLKQNNWIGRGTLLPAPSDTENFYYDQKNVDRRLARRGDPGCDT